MRRFFFKILVRIEKKQGLPYKLLILGNELFIRLRKVFFGLKTQPVNFAGVFNANNMAFAIKVLGRDGAEQVRNFFEHSINTDSPDFFLPHKTDRKALDDIMKRSSHIPMGIYHGKELVGYGLIRLLFPNKGSYAIFIADKWQGMGVGTAGLGEMLEFIRLLGFVPYSAVGKHNSRSIGMLKKLDMELAEDLGEYFEVKDKIRR